MQDPEMHLARSDNEHLDRRFDEVLGELKKIHSAFATNDDGSVDFEGHRRFHEEKLRAARAEAEFWSELKLEIAKKGVWALMVTVFGLVAIGISAKLGLK